MKKVAIVVGVVIACVIVGGIAYYFLTKEEGLPLYPGATKSLLKFEELTGKSLPAGVDVTLYTVDASVDNVIDWYRTKMPERGWTKIGEGPYNNIGYTLGYMKGDKGAGISAMNWAGQTFLMLIHGPLEAFQKLA